MEVIEEKIQRIAKEMEEACASPWTIAKIVKELAEAGTTSEKRLREKSLEMLKELDPNSASTYERFSKMMVYTTEEKTKQFNRGNIVNSLLKETTIPRSVAEKITNEVENQIKDSKIEFLTPSLIRELVNSKLISYGFEEIRNNYTRVGEPVYDIKQRLEREPIFGEGAREYNLLLEIPKKARELHYNGVIHIEDTEGYSHRPYSYSIITEKKETAQKTISGAIKQIAHNRKYFYLQPSIYGLTFALGAYAKTNKDAKKLATQIIDTAEILEETPTISLELYTPTKLEELGQYRLNAAKISNELLGENTVVGIDSKYPLKLLDLKGKQFMILNNTEDEYYPLSKNLFSPTQGIMLYININLEKIQAENEKEFFEELKTIADEIELLKQKKTELLTSRNYLKQFLPQEMKTAIGLTNLTMIGETYTQGKPLEFATRAYKEISKLFEHDLLFGLSSEKVRKRFTQAANKEVYSQETLGFDECLKEKKCCFTGKASSIKELNELIDRKVKQIEFAGL